MVPIRIGDTLRVRYAPAFVRRSKTKPHRGVVTFRLDLVNQREEYVLAGEADLMLDMPS